MLSALLLVSMFTVGSDPPKSTPQTPFPVWVDDEDTPAKPDRIEEDGDQATIASLTKRIENLECDRDWSRYENMNLEEEIALVRIETETSAERRKLFVELLHNLQKTKEHARPTCVAKK